MMIQGIHTSALHVYAQDIHSMCIPIGHEQVQQVDHTGHMHAEFLSPGYALHRPAICMLLGTDEQ